MVAGVERAHVAPELEEQDPRQESTAGNGDGHPGEDGHGRMCTGAIGHALSVPAGRPIDKLGRLVSFAVMPRPRLHSTETILDAARGLVLDRGTGAATVIEIARTSGAPAGSIYHRFPSLDELFTQVWIRAVRRSQAEFAAAAAAAGPDPVHAAVAAALSVFDFCERHPADARLLLSFRREDLLQRPLGEAARRELAELNEPVREVTADFARRLYGRASRPALDRVALALFDLPHGAVRRPLIEGQKLTPGRRAALAAAVRAALED